MQQVETLSQGINQLLVLGRILTQVNLGLAVAGIRVILTAGQEIVALLIVVLVKDGNLKFGSKLPALLIITVAGMRAGTGSTYNNDIGILGTNLVIYELETLFKLRGNLLLVSKTQILEVEGLRMTCIGTCISSMGTAS